MTDLVSLSWQPEGADWVEAMRAHYRHRRPRLWLPAVLIAVVSAACISTAVWADDTSGIVLGATGLVLAAPPRPTHRTVG